MASFTRLRLHQVLALSSFLFAVACDTRIAVRDDYSRVCVQDDDCALVAQGDVCNGSCMCFNGAIATSDVDTYKADVEALEVLCGPIPSFISCGSCGEFVAFCDEGRCTPGSTN
jgi:hypothetical protein